jgi:hypothetical protein
MAYVTSSAVGAGATTMSTTEKAETSTATPTGGEQDDLCMSDPQPTLDLQPAEARGACTKDDVDRCLYVGTPWEEDITTDRRDADDFKVVSHTIRCVLEVMIHALMLQSFVPDPYFLGRSQIEFSFLLVVVACRTSSGSSRSAAGSSQRTRRGRRGP